MAASGQSLARDFGRGGGVEWSQLLVGCRWGVDCDDGAERLGSVEDIGSEVVLGLGGSVDGRTESHLIFEVVVLGRAHCKLWMIGRRVWSKMMILISEGDVVVM